MSAAASQIGTVPSRSRVDADTNSRLANRAKWLSWGSLVYMTFEGAVAILAGVLAGSVALIGFGLDSAIEGFASAIIVWRFTGNASSAKAPSCAPRSSSPSSSSSSPRTSDTRRSQH